MATLASLGGNFTAAASWALCDPTAALDSEASAFALTAANVDSSAFIPAAVAIDAVAIKLASRAAGSPTNTITVTLRNSTTSTNVSSVTINVSDLDVSTTADHAGGWYFFKLASTHTPNGTDSYVVRVILSATTTSVNLWVLAGNNFSRQLRTTTTQAPAAGDKMIIGGEFTGAGTGNNIAIAMNNTATTLFGAVTTVTAFTASLSVGKRGTLTWGTTAATNYVLRLAGHFTVHSGGAVTMGTSGTPVPRDSTAVLEFTPTTTNDSGVYITNGGSFNAWGLSRTSGKDFHYTKLTADAAAAATSLTVADDTGWLSGDDIAIAGTKRTANHGELRTLNAGAGASSLSISAGLTNAHDGSAANSMQGEVIVLTRNVKIRSTDSTKRTFVFSDATAIGIFHWVEFRYLGEASNHLGIECNPTTGSFTLNKCSLRDFNGMLQATAAALNNLTWTSNVWYNTASGSSFCFRIAQTSTQSGITVTDNIIAQAAPSLWGFHISALRGTVTGNVAAGCGTGFVFADTNGILGSIDNNTVHSGNLIGFQFASIPLDGKTITGLYSWRQGGYGVDYTPVSSATPNVGTVWADCMFIGNSSGAFNQVQGGNIDWIFRNLIAAGDSSFASTVGLALAVATIVSEIRFENCKFGVAELNRVAHVSNDINYGGVIRVARHSFWNSKLSSTTRFGNTGSLADPSYMSEMKRQQVAGAHQVFWPRRGTVANDTTTTHSAGGAEKMTPLSATLKLISGSKYAAVANGGTITFGVYVRKDGTYAGSAPRLILKANPAAGILADVVLDTLSVGTDTWEQLSGTSAAVTDDAVLEVVVDCDGTAGNVYVDDWTVS